MNIKTRGSSLPVWSVLYLFLILPARAQDRYIEVALRNGRPIIYHEAIVLPGAASAARDAATASASRTAATASIHFRIPNNLLVFRQSGGGFVSDVEVSAEIFAAGQKRDERVWRRTHQAASFEATKSKTTDLTGFIEFELPPGEYSYRLRAGEGVAVEFGGTPPKQFVVPDASRLWRPFFVESVVRESSNLELEPTNLRGDAPFSRRVEAAVPVTGFTDSAAVAFTLYRIAPVNETMLDRAVLDERYAIRNEDVFVRNGEAGTIVPLGVDSRNDCFCRDVPIDSGAHLALMDIGTDKLEDGTYVLNVQLRDDEEVAASQLGNVGEAATAQLIFRTHWRDMPLSLYDVNVAIRNLEFIENRDRVRALLRGSREERIEKLRAFWRERDPTPGTLANELMEEYYRRIDHAALEYRTGGAPYPDGLYTDAARIYIVHGPPEKVTHSFPSSGGVEQVWRYSNGRVFVFRSASSLEPLELVDDGRDGRDRRDR